MFQYLDTVLRTSEEKFKINNKTDTSRQSWGRLIVHCVKTYGDLLQTAQLDQLAKDIEAIKEHIGMKA